MDVDTFVLMANHVHLLVTPEMEKGVSQLMQSLGRYYVIYINKTYQRTGTLWQGRYKSTLVDSANYFLLVSRYIELNPVRAEQWVTGGGAPRALWTLHSRLNASGNTRCNQQSLGVR
ncbi:transposase [Glaciecola sp. 33A]|jgi:REP element-mobilizing transposase RayT|uniref:transposase n=1 Tax=Glaciecola sp. 33A TaxID=2057807 RepID=UPI002696853B